MAELNPGLAGERWNRLILEAPEILRTQLENAVRNLFQSGFALGTEPIRDKAMKARAFTEREPLLRAMQFDPAVSEEDRLRAGKELIEGERLLREVFG